MRSVLAVVCCAAGASIASAQDQVLPFHAPHRFAPLAAQTALSVAENQAKAQNKAVLVIFHASWCGWCHKLEGFLAQPSVKRVMDANYVTVTLDVLEQPDKKSLENAGGEDKMKELGGDQAGLPFLAILDSNGKALTDSNLAAGQPSTNIGYPAKSEEIDHFMLMLGKSAPRMRQADRMMIRQWLIDNAPKSNS